MGDHPEPKPTEPKNWQKPITLTELKQMGQELDGCHPHTAGTEWRSHDEKARAALAGKLATNTAEGGVGLCVEDHTAWKLLLDVARRPRRAPRNDDELAFLRAALLNVHADGYTSPVPTAVEKALNQFLKAVRAGFELGPRGGRPPPQSLLEKLRDAVFDIEFACAPVSDTTKVTRIQLRPLEARAPVMVVATISRVYVQRSRDGKWYENAPRQATVIAPSAGDADQRIINIGFHPTGGVIVVYPKLLKDERLGLDGEKSKQEAKQCRKACELFAEEWNKRENQPGDTGGHRKNFEKAYEDQASPESVIRSKAEKPQEEKDAEKRNTPEGNHTDSLLRELLKEKESARSTDRNRKAERRAKKTANFRDIEYEMYEEAGEKEEWLKQWWPGTVRETGAPGRVCLPKIRELDVREMVNDAETFFEGFATEYAIRAHNQWMRKKETATGFATLTYYEDEKSSDMIPRTEEEIQQELDQASQGNAHIRDTMEASAERVAFECRDRMRAFKQLLAYKREHPQQQSTITEEMKLRTTCRWSHDSAAPKGHYN
eukprot:gene38043-61808_t